MKLEIFFQLFTVLELGKTSSRIEPMICKSVLDEPLQTDPALKQDPFESR